VGAILLDESRNVTTEDVDLVEFVTAGTAAAGEYHCAACGYGVTVHAALPLCPMCGGTTWEPAAWSPFSRAPGRLQ
jgi:rubrerythrin